MSQESLNSHKIKNFKECLITEFLIGQHHYSIVNKFHTQCPKDIERIDVAICGESYYLSCCFHLLTPSLILDCDTFNHVLPIELHGQTYIQSKEGKGSRGSDISSIIWVSRMTHLSSNPVTVARHTEIICVNMCSGATCCPHVQCKVCGSTIANRSMDRTMLTSVNTSSDT